jgi:hypothetical protein
VDCSKTSVGPKTEVFTKLKPSLRVHPPISSVPLTSFLERYFDFYYFHRHRRDSSVSIVTNIGVRNRIIMVQIPAEADISLSHSFKGAFFGNKADGA